MIYEESVQIFYKTLQVLYSKGPEECREAFREYAHDVLTNGEDPAFSNFIKTTILEFKTNFETDFLNSNLTNLVT